MPPRLHRPRDARPARHQAPGGRSRFFGCAATRRRAQRNDQRGQGDASWGTLTIFTAELFRRVEPGAAGATTCGTGGSRAGAAGCRAKCESGWRASGDCTGERHRLPADFLKGNNGSRSGTPENRGGISRIVNPGDFLSAGYGSLNVGPAALRCDGGSGPVHKLPCAIFKKSSSNHSRRWFIAVEWAGWPFGRPITHGGGAPTERQLLRRSGDQHDDRFLPATTWPRRGQAATPLRIVGRAIAVRYERDRRPRNPGRRTPERRKHASQHNRRETVRHAR